MKPDRGIVFDGDDTLWFIEALYDNARAAAAAIAAGDGLDPAEWTETQLLVDLDNVTRMGLARDRFPTSCAQAYRLSMLRAGRRPRRRTERAIIAAASTVFDARAPLAQDAETVLSQLSERYRLALLTKGDRGVQEQRIGDSGLRRWFEIVEIVDKKEDESFVAVSDMLQVPTTSMWSVGNSLASDINPALRVGMSAVWIDAHVWAHERREVEPHEGTLILAHTLAEAGRLLLRATADHEVDE